jgi:micrococcal nuclease
MDRMEQRQWRKPSRVFGLLLLVGAFSYPAAFVHALTGKVVGVSDGDTITVLDGTTEHKIRLFGVDSPEKHQPFGTRAKQFTSDMVFRKTVQVESVTRDRYGRTVGIVKVEGRTLNEELVRAGMAWVYPDYCKRSICTEWRSLESHAHAQRRGLWQDAHPVPPWNFRRSRRS